MPSTRQKLCRFESEESNALLIASKNGINDTIKSLLESGSNVNHVDVDGWDALMFASQNGHHKTVELLLKNESKCNRVEKDGWDALMLASQYGFDKTVELLLKNGSNCKRVEKDGWDALMLASHKGHCKTAKLLLKHESDINRVDKYGRNALMLASRYGHVKTVKLLLKYVYTLKTRNNNVLNSLPETSSEQLLKKTFIQKTFAVYLGDIIFLAFEEGHIEIIETVSTFVNSHTEMSSLVGMITFLCNVCKRCKYYINIFDI